MKTLSYIDLKQNLIAIQLEQLLSKFGIHEYQILETGNGLSLVLDDYSTPLIVYLLDTGEICIH